MNKFNNQKEMNGDAFFPEHIPKNKKFGCVTKGYTL